MKLSTRDLNVLLQHSTPWLRLALSSLGLSEISGSQHNPLILQWWKAIRAPFTDDETPWCAAFVGGVLEHCGLRSTRSAAARSYQNWGTKLDGPCVGAVVVFWRGSPNSAKGHVGFVVGRDKFNNLLVLGGNQGNKVSIKAFPYGRVIGYRWPKALEAPGPTGTMYLPTLDVTSGLSTNEA